MIALTLAAALTLGTVHRLADFRPGATTMNERVLAIDGDRVITWRAADQTVRAVPLADPAAATTLIGGLYSPIAAPPLIAWNTDTEGFVTSINAPGKILVLPNTAIFTIACNATACLADAGAYLMLLSPEAKPLGQVTGEGWVMAADPGGFLVLSRGPALSVTRIDNSGAVTFNATVAPAAPHAWEIAVDFDGERYSLVWTDFASRGMGFPSTLRGASIGLAGDVRPAGAIANLPNSDFNGVVMAYAGGRHLVAFSYIDYTLGIDTPGYMNPARILAVRLDGALQPLDSAPFVVTDTGWTNLGPVVVPRDGSFLVAWSHSSGMIFSLDPEAAEVRTDGTVGPRMILSSGVAPQQVSSAAMTSAGLVETWLDTPREGDGPVVNVRRFATDGTPLIAPVQLASGPFTVNTATAARDGDALIVWGQDTGAAILHADGTLQTIALPPLSGYPAVAANRDGWMIVIGQSDSLTAIRVDANGQPSPPQTLASASGLAPNVAVGSDGERFLVVWFSPVGTGNPVCNFVPCEERAELLDATGGVLASRIPLGSMDNDLSVTFAGGEYLIAGQFSAMRVDGDGARIGDVTLPSNRFHTRFAPFGNAALACWGESDGIHVATIDHGAVGPETLLSPVADSAVALSSNGIAYDIGGVATAAVFRPIISPRRRAAAR